MKNIFILTTLLFSLKVSAQKSEVITLASKTKTEIFNKTLLWIEKTWGTNSDKVIDSQDEASGTIRVKGGLKAVPKTDEGNAVKGLTATELTILVENGKATLNFQFTTFK